MGSMALMGATGQIMKVFIENPAGLAIKHHHDEKSLKFLGTTAMSRAYPYPYGFVLGTTGEDGDNVDCFIITSARLNRGEIVECRAIGLMEQLEDGLVDHNVLATLDGEQAFVDERTQELLSEFVGHVYEHDPSKGISVGQFLNVDAADAFIQLRRDA
jgi:inorganic pyrophosphatase